MKHCLIPSHLLLKGFDDRIDKRDLSHASPISDLYSVAGWRPSMLITEALITRSRSEDLSQGILRTGNRPGSGVGNRLLHRYVYFPLDSFQRFGVGHRLLD